MCVGPALSCSSSSTVYTHIGVACCPVAGVPHPNSAEAMAVEDGESLQ
jgi:hypothetical protein